MGGGFNPPHYMKGRNNMKKKIEIIKQNEAGNHYEVQVISEKGVRVANVERYLLSWGELLDVSSEWRNIDGQIMNGEWITKEEKEEIKGLVYEYIHNQPTAKCDKRIYKNVRTGETVEGYVKDGKFIFGHGGRHQNRKVQENNSGSCIQYNGVFWIEVFQSVETKFEDVLKKISAKGFEYCGKNENMHIFKINGHNDHRLIIEQFGKTFDVSVWYMPDRTETEVVQARTDVSVHEIETAVDELLVELEK